MFDLGTHHPHWLAEAGVPLFVSRRRLFKYRALPRAIAPWKCDSGAFSELSLFGEWTIAPREYAIEVRRYKDEIGKLVWAASMDFMCEPWILKKTGGTVEQHQDRTVANFLTLLALAPDLPWTPVLQGWTLNDYERCAEKYQRAGVNLYEWPVGLGSVCRRQGTDEIAAIVTRMRAHGLRLHGFGVKTLGLAKFAHLLESADSAAWSFHARRMQRPAFAECTHINCANCLRFALDWRMRLLAGLPSHQSESDNRHSVTPSAEEPKP